MARRARANEWTIVHRRDPAMDLHLTLLADAADEALRGLRAMDARTAARLRSPSHPTTG
jgi:hypothetical protein